MVNLTPHTVTLRAADGDRVYESAGNCRASQKDTPAPHIDGMPVVRRTYGAIEGLPDPVPGTIYIVSTIVASAAIAAGRDDVVAPDSGPSAIRENGQIVAVLGWVIPG